MSQTWAENMEQLESLKATWKNIIRESCPTKIVFGCSTISLTIPGGSYTEHRHLHHFAGVLQEFAPADCEGYELMSEFTADEDEELGFGIGHYTNRVRVARECWQYRAPDNPRYIIDPARLLNDLGEILVPPVKYLELNKLEEEFLQRMFSRVMANCDDIFDDGDADYAATLRAKLQEATWHNQ